MKTPWNIKPMPMTWNDQDSESERKRIYDKVYNTQRWKTLRKAFITAYPLCCMCKANNRIVKADVVDHITPIRLNGDAWNWGNLQSLCKQHHAIKTNTEINKKGGALCS